MDWQDSVTESGVYVVHDLKAVYTGNQVTIKEMRFGVHEACSWLEVHYFSGDKRYFDTVYSCQYSQYFANKRFLKLDIEYKK